MNADYFRTLFGYNAWANHKLWDCITQLSDEQFTRDLEFSRGSIRSQLKHVMECEYWWPAYLCGKRDADFQADIERWKLDDQEPSREALRAIWDEVEAMNQTYLDALTQEELERTFVFAPKEGESYTHTPMEILTQVAMHSLDHRAQIMAMIHPMGAPTFTQDYIRYVREGQGK